jgi:predicted transcriptional regulator
MQLGTLEKKIMEIIWSQLTDDRFAVRDIMPHVPKKYAYNTIQTVVTHLHEKKLLQRTKEGKTCFYTIALSKADFIKRAWKEFFNEMHTEYGSIVVAQFADFVDDIDPALLRKAKKRLNSSSDRS